MTTIVFGEKEKVKGIDLNTLRQTTSLAEYSGKLPQSKPVEHHELIDLLGEKLDKNNYGFKIDPIYVAKSESKRIMRLDPDKVGTPESYLFQRLVTRMKLTGPLMNEEHGSTIALGYNERGLQVAFGTNVHICQNMCIFAQRIMQTYGPQSIPFDKILELIDKNINEMPQIFESDNNLLSSMRNIQISQEDIVETVGDMHINAVNAAYFKGDFAMNIGQVSSFTKGLITEMPDVVTARQTLPSDISLYDFYNTGTRILHPEQTHDVVNLWPDNAKWGDYIVDRFINEN